MKNLHLLPTDKPSRLVLDSINNNLFLTTTKSFPSDIMKFKNIYITSDEEIKADGEWYYNTITNAIFQMKYLTEYDFEQDKKIILTTDQELIADGVQAIDDDFLEWFVKNPSCEQVKVVDNLKYFNVDELRERHLKGLSHLYSEKIGYKIIIPEEEPKQETLEEVAERLHPEEWDWREREIFKDGAKWQAERSYSEEDIREAFENGVGSGKYQAEYGDNAKGSMNFEYFIEQFKKK